MRAPVPTQVPRSRAESLQVPQLWPLSAASTAAARLRHESNTPPVAPRWSSVLAPARSEQPRPAPARCLPRARGRVMPPAPVAYDSIHVPGFPGRALTRPLKTFQAVPPGPAGVAAPDSTPRARAAAGGRARRRAVPLLLQPGRRSGRLQHRADHLRADDRDPPRHGVLHRQLLRALSGDSGRTWTYINPYTRFPARDGGFCCDQRALTVPHIGSGVDQGMTVWLL